jgi:hypothetical protein
VKLPLLDRLLVCVVKEILPGLVTNKLAARQNFRIARRCPINIDGDVFGFNDTDLIETSFLMDRYTVTGLVYI